MRAFSELIRLLGCAAALWCVASSGVRADPLRGLVRIAEDEDRALYERIRGQASDLDVALSAVEAAPLEAARADQLTQARELGNQGTAQLVIWFARTPDALEVLVADLAAERLFVRPIAHAAELDRSTRSAEGEAAALVVRSAIKASLVGAALGTTEEALAPPPAIVALPPPPVVVEAPRPSPPPRVLRFRLGAGARASLDGASEPAQFGAIAQLGVVERAFEFGVRGAFGLPADVPAQVAELSLSQHEVAAYAVYAPSVAPRLQLTVELALGLAVYATRVETARAELTPQRGRAPFAAIDLAVGARAWVHERLALAWSVELSTLPIRPEVGYDSAAGFVVVERLSRLQPRLASTLITRF